jgi:hypothetical protein
MKIGGSFAYAPKKTMTMRGAIVASVAWAQQKRPEAKLREALLSGAACDRASSPIVLLFRNQIGGSGR